MQYEWPEDVTKAAPTDPLAMTILLGFVSGDLERVLAPHRRASLDLQLLLWRALRAKYGAKWYEVLKIMIAWSRLAV